MLKGWGGKKTTKSNTTPNLCLNCKRNGNNHPLCQLWKTNCVTLLHNTLPLLLQGMVACVENPVEKQWLIEMLTKANAY